jgi:hypothetical protein
MSLGDVIMGYIPHEVNQKTGENMRRADRPASLLEEKKELLFSPLLS